MTLSREKRLAALEKELRAVEKQEKKLEKAAAEAKPAAWKTALREKIPAGVYTGLESAFAKGFALVFSKGRAILEKSYSKQDRLDDHSIRDYAVQVKGGRKELRVMHKNAVKNDFANLAVTTVEGVALGALGVGLPDIVLFLSMLLRGVYQTALSYGYDYADRAEQRLILKMMAAALSSGADRTHRSAEVDVLLTDAAQEVSQQDLDAQMQQTAAVFAVDMLVLKFLQGLPVVGVIGGAANPVYYRRVLQYVQLKYRRRYLLAQKRRMTAAPAMEKNKQEVTQ